MIVIKSKKQNFCRCGVRHSIAPTYYPDDRFSQEELKRLVDEPMLIVEIIKDEKEEANDSDPRK